MKYRCLIVCYLIMLMCDDCYSKCNATFQNVLAEVSFDGTTFLQEHINGYLENRPIQKISFKGFVPMLCRDSIRNMPKLENIILNGVGLFHLESFHWYVPTLKHVRISSNPISRIRGYDFPQLTLDTLDLSSNMIKELTEKAFQNIYVNILNLNNNRLVKLPMLTFHMAKISELYLENNQIAELRKTTFYGISDIKRIYLNHNNIHYIEDYTFKTLGAIHLNLLGNDLTGINFLKNASLKRLDISLNKISYLSLDNFTSIESIRITPNPWHCECLKKFWKYAETHDINIVRSGIQYDTKPICIAASIECLDNYNYDKVRDLYFKLFSYY